MVYKLYVRHLFISWFAQSLGRCNITTLQRTIKRQIEDSTMTTKIFRYKFIEQTNRRMKQKSIFFEDIENFDKFVFECEK